MIKCNIDFNIKSASIFIEDNFIETKSFDDLSYKKETSKDFKICNDLYLINKISIYLKVNYNAKEVDTLFIIDNKDVYKLLKPDNILIKKLTKSMKKDISNNELKLILGSTLFEMNSIKNIDLVLCESDNMKGDENMFNNINDITNNNFNLKSKDSTFNLDDDFDFDLDSPLEPTKSSSEIDFSNDFEFDLGDDISILPFSPSDSNTSILPSKEDDSNKNDADNLDLIIDENENETIEDENNELIDEENSRYSFVEEDSTLNDDSSSIKELTSNNAEEDLSKNDESSGIKITNRNDDLKIELLEEFKNLENYINEQIDSLEEQSKKLEDENSKLKLNFNDLNIDEETIIKNFNKSMEIRLRLKVIKKSCKIYNNIKTQLEDELSKF